jgi:hypothetical protein
MKHPKLQNATSSWGASMGRSDFIKEPDEPIKFRLYRMPMMDGCYDTGGAYWGSGNYKIGWMYHAYGDGPKFKNELFIRAKSREEAKAEVRHYFKQAKFYR